MSSNSVVQVVKPKGPGFAKPAVPVSKVNSTFAGNVVQGDRYEDLADIWATYDRDERVSGLFSNDPLLDLENRLIKKSMIGDGEFEE